MHPHDAAHHAEGLERPIGVFDSGVGGLSVLRALRATLPTENFIYFADSAYAPYGERAAADITARSETITQQLLAAHHIKALVIACNTATAVAVHTLRQAHPDLPIVGLEPALKPALGATRSGRVGVIATRGTLSSAKFAALLAAHAQAGGPTVVTQACDGLAEAIERNDRDLTQTLCERYISAMGPFGKAPGQIDTLVLGCTHYPFVAENIRALVGPEVQLIDTADPVARHTRELLSRTERLNPGPGAGQLTLETSGSHAALNSAATRWL